MIKQSINQDMSCKRRKRKPACSKAKCSKPGPVTNNGYLNFIRVYRKKHCGLLPRELVSKAARAWNCLPERSKNKYRRQACGITKRRGKCAKRRSACNM